MTKLKSQFDFCKQNIRLYCGTSAERGTENDCHDNLLLARSRADESGIRDFSKVSNLSRTRERSNLLLQENDQKKRAFLRHLMCMRDLRALKIEPCLSNLVHSCHDKLLHVAKVVRLRMSDVGLVLNRLPDLHVVYLVRDPRAIINSRVQSRKLMWDKTNRKRAREASILCPRMSDDVSNLRILQGNYPEAIHTIRYEDFVDDPVGVAEKVYSSFSMNQPKDWASYSESVMYSSDGASGGGFGIKVNDARKVADRWKTDIPRKEIININKQCSYVISALGYDV